MKLSELYQHKAAYDEIMAVLAKHKQLPRVDDLDEYPLKKFSKGKED